MRLTIHNARAGKDGVFSPKHNDRNFNPENSEHIDPERSKDNTYWHYYHSESPQMTFEDVEKRFYSETFTEALEAQNGRHRKARHKERIKTMDEYRKSEKTCPEESIYQVGKVGDTIDPELFKKIFIEQINWEMETYPNMKVLDYAIHNDEQGASHAHVRRVWIAESDDGAIVSQGKALKAMGIERPDINKKKTRDNNPKKAITQQIRNHCIKVCESYGVEIEKEPQDASKSGLDLITYKANQEKAKASKAKEEAEQAEDSKNKALEAKKQAEDSKNQALKDKEDAENSKNEALKAKKEAEKAKNEAEQRKNEALRAKIQAENDSRDTIARADEYAENSKLSADNYSKNVKGKANKYYNDLKTKATKENEALNVENKGLKAKNESLKADNNQLINSKNAKTLELNTLNNNIQQVKQQAKVYDEKAKKLPEINSKIEINAKILGDILKSKTEASEIKSNSIKDIFGRAKNTETKTYEKDMIEKVEGIGERVASQYNAMFNNALTFNLREQKLKQREAEVSRRETELQKKSDNIDNIIAQKLNEKVEKVLNPIRQTSEVERLKKFMKKFKAGNNKTVYDLYQEDLRKKINRDLVESFEQQKQQQNQSKNRNDLELY